MSDYERVYAIMTDYAAQGPKQAGDLAGLCYLMGIRLAFEHGETETEIRATFDDVLEMLSPRREN